jgi:hypothetical protein
MKVANSYASLLRGVSQQVPQDRTDGQHTEQVNLLSDPVDGLTRRHGSIWQAERLLPDMTGAQLYFALSDFGNYVTIPFDSGGKAYVILYRKAAPVVPEINLPPFFVYNKTDKVFLPTVRPSVDSVLDAIGGVAAATQVGKYLFFAGRDTAVAGSSTDLWGSSPNNGRTVIWVRGGAFSRTFSVTVRTTGGVEYTFSHTTPPSSYQGVLDTSDIASSDPDYTKKVNDRVNAYNAAVTAWIGTSTEAVQPKSITNGLWLAAIAAGVPGLIGVVKDTTIVIQGIAAVTVTDGGDNSLIRGVANEVDSASAVSPIHYVGKVVKVRGQGSAEAYYLKAVAKDAGAIAGTLADVVWVEGAGIQHSITSGILYGTIVGGTFYYASSATLLATLTSGPHPEVLSSTTGDHDTSPMPFFVGQKVTYMGTFQSRLLIGAGGVLALSRTEDYLNFFRSTVLTLPADDPFEMLPQGSADDELRYGVLYDRDLVIFGKKRQYVVSGSQALTPTGASMPVLASYEDSADASPVAAGGFIFYTKRGDNTTGVFQIQPGQTENSPESFPASSQIATYINGGATELAISTGSPSHLLIRTTAAPHSLYVFTYLDKQDGRKMDAWSRWDFSPELGSIVGVSNTDKGPLTFSLRVRPGSHIAYIVADLCPLKTGVSDLPYLDSNRPALPYVGSLNAPVAGPWAAAFSSASARRFTGAPLEDIGELTSTYPLEPGLTVGALQEAYFVPTNPYMRDGKDKAILSGRLTVTRMTVAYKDTGGIKWAVTSNGTTNEVEFSGRILGSPSNLIGIEPISTGQHNLPIGRETRQFSLRIAARDWHPFTVTAMEYTGQFFNRVQRF